MALKPPNLAANAASASRKEAAAGTRDYVLDTAILIMRPLVKLMIAKGILFVDVTERLKRLFVDVASRDFSDATQKNTDSRISIMTGVHRKDVKRFREEDSGVRETKEGFSPPAQVMSRWGGESRFMRAGKARPLYRRKDVEARNGKAAREATFEDLVESVSKDIPVRALLEEWLRVGLVQVDDDGAIHLDALWAGVQNDEQSFLNLAAVHGHDRLQAAVTNFLTGQHRCPIYSVDARSMSAADVDSLRKLFEERGQKFMNSFNDRATKLREKIDKSEGTVRLGMGLYFYSEDMTEPASMLSIE
jgi:hypothetical protein